MTTSATASPAPDQILPSSFIRRWRYAAVAMALVALAFAQNPGRIAADTKLDLFVDPGALMAKAAHLWEPLGFFGQLQNQAYGYLFPMGPFFWIFDTIGIPTWVTQRLWWAMLLVLAFAGVARLVVLLGFGGFGPQVLGGLAYALAPRMVTEISVLSVEVLPYAMAPWVLVPLVALARGGSVRRAAAASGLAVLCVGGVNAVATAAVLPLAAWWIVTRFRGRIRVSLALWWSASVALATAWWALPLLLLGRYSPPFLDWIESASVTTAVTSPDTVLRGTSTWVAYITETGGPVWAAGWALVTSPLLIVVSGAVATVGIIGVCLRGNPYRLFLIGGLFGGIALVSLGHVGDLTGFGAESMRALLDAALAPLRNTHKFDLILRIPLALGFAYAVHRVLVSPRWKQGRSTYFLAAATAVVVAGSAPLWTGNSTQDRSFIEVPQYWTQASAWLELQETNGRALVVPGASFAVFSWGRTNDEPFQALAQTPWVVRDAVPLATAGSIRLLDAVTQQLENGRGSPGLADVLSRSGIEWIVLRNDIDVRRTGSPRLDVVRQALTSSPGIVAANSFGPVLSGSRLGSLVVDRGLSSDLPAVEVFRVAPSAAQPDLRIAVRPASDIVVMTGASEALMELADGGQLGEQVVVFAGDEKPVLALAEPGSVRTGVTDSFPRSLVDFGRARDNRSVTLTQAQVIEANRPVTDYLPVSPIERQSVVEWRGGEVSASSSAGFGVNAQPLVPAAGAWSAVDGDDVTAWESARRTGSVSEGIGQWWQVTWNEPVDLSELRGTFVIPGNDAASTQTIAVTTDTGTRETVIEATGNPQVLAISPGLTSFVRLTLVSAEGNQAATALAISNLVLPERVERWVVVPGVVDGGPILLRANADSKAGCFASRGIVACAPGASVPGAERAGLQRSVTVAQTGEYRLDMTVRPRSGAALDELLDEQATGDLRAFASSRLVPDAAMRPQSMVDGSQETAWVAAVDDRRPEVELRWPTPRVVRGVRLGINPELAVSRPLSVTAEVNGRQTTTIANDDGVVRFPAQEATSVLLTFNNVVPLRSLDPLTGVIEVLPIGFSEVALIGQDTFDRRPTPDQVIEVPCGQGPTVVINGKEARDSSVAMKYGEVVADTQAPTRLCGGRIVTLSAGVNTIRVDSTPEFTVQSVVLQPRGATAAGPVVSPTNEDVEVVEWGPGYREVNIDVAEGPRVLEVNENFNAGWSASLDGEQLQPFRVDGWRQAFWLPADARGDVAIRFVPDTTYRWGLAAGAVLAAGLIALVSIPGRRRIGPVSLISRPWHRWIIATVGVLAAGGLAGVVGLGIAGVTMIALWLSRKNVTRVWLIAGALGAATLLAATWAWPTRSGAPTWVEVALTVLTVLGLAAATAPVRETDDASTAGLGVQSETTIP